MATNNWRPDAWLSPSTPGGEELARHQSRCDWLYPHCSSGSTLRARPRIGRKPVGNASINARVARYFFSWQSESPQTLFVVGYQM